MIGLVSLVLFVSLKIFGFVGFSWVEIISISFFFLLTSLFQPRVSYIRELVSIINRHGVEIESLEEEISELKSELSSLEDDYHRLNRSVNPDKYIF